MRTLVNISSDWKQRKQNDGYKKQHWQRFPTQISMSLFNITLTTIMTALRMRLRIDR